MPSRDHEDFAGLHDLVMAVGGHPPGMLSWSSDSVTTRVTARPIWGLPPRSASGNPWMSNLRSDSRTESVAMMSNLPEVSTRPYPPDAHG